MSSDRLDPPLLRMITVILLGGLLGILNSTMSAVATDTLACLRHLAEHRWLGIYRLPPCRHGDHPVRYLGS